MVITWSGIGITNGKGILGGTILSGNKYGRMASIRRNPSIRYGKSQMLQRNRFQKVISSWQSISDADRAGWNTEAATGDWDYTNSIGETIQPSGFQLFTTLNLNLSPADTSIETAPSKPILAPPLLTAVTATASSTLTLTFDDSTLNLGEHMKIFATRPLSAGIFEPRHSEYKFIGIWDSVGFSSPLAVGSEYVSVFKKVIADCSIFVKAVLLDGSTGDEASAGLIRTIAT